MTGYLELLYLLNLACVFISWNFATRDFNEGNKFGGYANLFASALNGAIILNHFI
jgi:hypothetical protein